MKSKLEAEQDQVIKNNRSLRSIKTKRGIDWSIVKIRKIGREGLLKKDPSHKPIGNSFFGVCIAYFFISLFFLYVQSFPSQYFKIFDFKVQSF